ncbi:Uncharacterised protein [Xylophilus ampelinus]|nr:Uncharacterised protein [Xylophilus ampelinus]
MLARVLDSRCVWIGRHDGLGRWRRPRACVLRRWLALTGLSCVRCARCPSTCSRDCTAPRMAPAPAGPRPPPWGVALHPLRAPLPPPLGEGRGGGTRRLKKPRHIQRGVPLTPPLPSGERSKTGRARPMPAERAPVPGRWCRCAGAGAIRGAVQCPRHVDSRRAHPSCRTTVSASQRRRTHTGAAGRVQAHSARADPPTHRPTDPPTSRRARSTAKNQKRNHPPAQASRASQPNSSQT